MKTLDIYENHSWSFSCDDWRTLKQLRFAVADSDEEARDRHLNQIAGKAYKIIGDPASIDLAADFFDEITVAFQPPPAKLAVLKTRAHRWSKADGTIRLPADLAERNRPDKELTFRDRFQFLVNQMFPRRSTPLQAD